MTRADQVIEVGAGAATDLAAARVESAGWLKTSLRPGRADPG